MSRKTLLVSTALLTMVLFGACESPPAAITPGVVTPQARRDAGKEDAGREDAGSDAGGADAGAADAGSVTPTKRDAGVDPSAYLAWCTGLAESTCQKGLECKDFAPALLEACRIDRRAAYCTRTSSIANGYVGFDPAQAAVCATALLANKDCAVSGRITLSFGPPECQTVFTAREQSNEPCNESRDCVSPGNGCSKNACPFVCTTGGALGQPCLNSTKCNAGLFCDTSTNTCLASLPTGSLCAAQSADRCATGFCDYGSYPPRCGAAPTVGQKCGQPCKDCGSSECAAGHYCDYKSPATCQPLVATGAACIFQSQCQPGDFCKDSKCKPRITTGGACQRTSDCVTDDYCSRSTCVRRAQENEPCSELGNYETCASGYCDRVTLKCQAWALADGGACTGDRTVCGRPLTCKGAIDGRLVVTDAGVQRAPGTSGQCGTAAIGDECRRHASCTVTSTYCDANDGGVGHCAQAQVGSPCDPNSGNVNCPTGAFCNGATARCQTPAAFGQSCSFYDRCVDGLSCLPQPDGGTTRTCGHLFGPGTSCTSDSVCQVYVDCIDRACTPAGFIGQKCYGGDTCWSGYCDLADGGSQGPLCRPFKSDGDGCLDHSECASRSCLDQKCRATSCE